MATDISTSAIHGRDDLLALAERRLAAVREGQGHLLLLSGEAGIGKTRLLHAVQRLADGLHACGLPVPSRRTSSCPPGCCSTSGYAMSRSADADVADRGPRAGERSRRRHRRRSPTPATRTASAGCSCWTRRTGWPSLADDGPALLALEDLHWCDELSLEIVAHLARRLPSLPLLVVGTLRTDELHQDVPVRAWRSRMLLQRLAEEARLPRLDLEQTTRMVHELLPVEPAVAARWSSWSIERSGGVPLHVEELVNAAAQGRLAGRPALRPGHAWPRRSSSASGRCPASGQDCAVAAAVVRRSFDLELLAAVAGMPVEEAAASLDELVDRHFVHEESPGWFGYRHALIRDAIEAQRAARPAPRPARAGRRGGASPARARRRCVPLGPPRGSRRSSPRPRRRRRRRPSGPRRCPRTRRRSSCCTGRCAASVTTGSAWPTCSPGGPSRPPPTTSTRWRRRTTRRRGPAHRAAARSGWPRRLLPGLVAARHLLGDPLPARIALLDEGLGRSPATASW